MRREISQPISLVLLLLVGGMTLHGSGSAQAGYVGIFGGSPLYSHNTAYIDEIKNSGFTEVIVWNIEVHATGDLNFNGEFPLASNGAYIGSEKYPQFVADLAEMKQGSVERITFSIGSSNVGDFENVKALVNTYGTGSDSILYKNFQALKEAIPSLDAIDFDDENGYDAPSTVQFAVMLGNLGYKVMPAAYEKNDYWISVVSQINSQRPGTVDGVHLQCYSGGVANNPCSGWNFGSVPVYPGLSDKSDTPDRVNSAISAWHSQCDISGGFLWLYDEIVGKNQAAQYASAFSSAVS